MQSTEGLGSMSALRWIIALMLRWIIIALIANIIIWISVWVHALTVINSEMEYLRERVITENCLDVATGEYDKMVERLIRINESSNFCRFQINVGPYTEYYLPTQSEVLYQFNNATWGDDSFSVWRADPGTSSLTPNYVHPNYNYATAPQQNEPIAIKIQMKVYLPLIWYYGKTYVDDEWPENPNLSLRPSVMPNTKVGGAVVEKSTPALCLTMTRRHVVFGTKFFKGKTMDNQGYVY